MTRGFLACAAATIALLLTTDLAGLRPASTRAQVPPISPLPEIENFEEPELKPQLIQASALIDAIEARTTFGVDGSGLTAVVIDTGINTTHVDFTGRIVATADFTGEGVEDGHAHGSNCAGVIMANGVHVGIAPGANVYPIKALSNSGSGSWTWLRDALALVIADQATYDISVVNMSLGGGHFPNETDPAIVGDAVFQQIKTHIETLRASGVVVCVAAGNDFATYGSTQGMGFPAIVADSTSVGAVFDSSYGPDGPYNGGAYASATGAGRIAPWSERVHTTFDAACRTDMFAPGPNMTSAGIGSPTASSTMGGTSQATPCLAGVVMLMQEYHLREMGTMPSVDDIERWLRASSTRIRDGDDEQDNVVNTGLDFQLVNANDCLEYMRNELGIDPPNRAPTVEDIDPVTIECTETQNLVQLATVVDDPDGDALEVTWRVNGNVEQVDSAVAAGSTVTFDYNYPHGESDVQVTVFDGERSASGATTVTAADTTSPIVVVAKDVTVPVDFGEIVATNVRLEKPSVTDVCDPSPRVRNDAPRRFPMGKTTVTWTVTDADGNVATARQKVTVVNEGPKADAGGNLRRTSSSPKGAGVTLDGSQSSDPDGQTLSFFWQAKGVEFDDPTAAQPSGRFPFGTTKVKLTVTDPAGKKSVDSLEVNVRRVDKVQHRAYGTLANQYAKLAFLYAQYSVGGGNYDANALQGYDYATYGKDYAVAAGDKVRWRTSAQRRQAHSEYMANRYQQCYFDLYASGYLYSAYTATGDTNALYAYFYADYAQFYAGADLEN